MRIIESIGQSYLNTVKMIPIHQQEFDSLSEFYKYTQKTPINAIWKDSGFDQRSIYTDFEFSQTNNFDEAVKLMKNGWEDMSRTLEHKLQIMAKEVVKSTTLKSRFDVVGFQASVPRYLQGIPQNMINQKRVVIKQKVITINKLISCKASITKNDIVENSLKALMLVKKIEAQGFRVNLNVLFSTCRPSEQLVVKVRIKSANERLNVSKAAFPLVHPSMLRRLFFRYMEVTPLISDKNFKYGYGTPINKDNTKNEIFLPAIIDDKTMDDVIKALK